MQAVAKSPEKKYVKRIALKSAIKIASKDEGKAIKTLAYEECKKLAIQYALSNKIVYELHSEYNSLLQIAQAEISDRIGEG